MQYAGDITTIERTWTTENQGAGLPKDNTPRKRKRSDTCSIQQGDSERGRHVCAVCSKTFGRIEHLKRHAASHNGKRSFNCAVCDKAFYRQDTMHRHELIHRDESETSKPKGARACIECATSKVRCPGLQPCARCDSRGTECKYPDSVPRTSEYSSPSDNPNCNGNFDTNGYQRSNLEGPASVRSNPATGVPFTPSFWDTSMASPSKWLHASPDLAMSPGFSGRPTSQDHVTITATRTVQSPAFPSNMSPGFRMGPIGSGESTTVIEAPVLSSTRHWLDMVTAPQVTELDENRVPPVPQKSSAVGRFYLDSDGARLPKTGPQRRFTSRSSIPAQSPSWVPAKSLANRSYGFPAPEGFTKGASLGNVHFLDQKTYDHLYDYFREYCTVDTPFYPAFESPSFPPWDMLEWFIGLYLEIFQPLIPMLHLPTLDLSSGHWILALAIAAVGSHFSEMEQAEQYTMALHEYLRRALYGLIQTVNEELDPVLVSQVKLLSCIGWLYCGDESLEKDAWRYHCDLVTFCTTEWIQLEDGFRLSDDSSREATTRDWQRWKDIESRRRTGHAIWLVDCMRSYQFQRSAQLTLEDAKVPLPCQEVLWEAETAMQWRQVIDFSIPSASLVSATQEIYVDKRVESTMGEFSRILLIHALYRRSWEVEDYLRQPLSYWKPTAERQAPGTFQRDSIYLPDIPIYARWRDAACDSLDILHWRAHSVIGATSGLEHPTVLHLNLARVILLTPIRDIYNLAFSITKETPNMPEAQTQQHINAVRRWAREDQYKARLAMVHAGVLFWHVRRYSASGFYEPSAILLASLALWAYGTFTNKGAAPASGGSSNGDTQLGHDGGHVGDPEDDMEYPTSINLDRPADDEIVQAYIRRGDRMSAEVTGVGDIRGPQSPQRVLLMGSKLLSGLANWGYSRKAIRVLTKLAQHCAEQGHP